MGHATITDCTITDYKKNGIRPGGRHDCHHHGHHDHRRRADAADRAERHPDRPGDHCRRSATTRSAATSTPARRRAQRAQPVYRRPGGRNPNFGNSSSIAGNTVTGNDLGIYNKSTGTTISGNTVQGNPFEGILLDQGTATVSNNTITGNNIGIAVIAFAAGNTADSQGTLLSNNIFNNGNGGLAFPGGGIRLLVQTGATTTAQVTANFNRIVGNSVGLDNTTTTPADATLNWWGINTGPNTTGGDKASGNVSTSPWLVLSLALSPSTITAGGTSTVTASVTSDSSGATHLTAPFFPNGIPIAFGATGGTITPASALTQSGNALSSFISTTVGTATVSATLDNQTVSLSLMVTPPPTTQADLAVFKSVSNPTPNVGDTITYTITLDNGGPDPATGVVVGDTLPAGVTYVSSSASQGAYDPTTNLWTVGDVKVATPQTLVITATVVNAASIANTASIAKADQFDPDEGNNSDTTSIIPLQADLGLVKSVDDPRPNVGETVTFTVFLVNSGPAAATGVVVADPLPAGLQFVGASPAKGRTTAPRALGRSAG